MTDAPTFANFNLVDCFESLKRQSGFPPEEADDINWAIAGLFRDRRRRKIALTRDYFARAVRHAAITVRRVAPALGRLIARAASSPSGACAASGPPGDDPDPDQPPAPSALVEAEDRLYAGIMAHGAPVQFGTVIGGRTERIDDLAMRDAGDVSTWARAWLWHVNLGCGLVAKFKNGVKVTLAEELAPSGKTQPPAATGGNERNERAGKPSTSENITKSLEPQGLKPDREAAERAINRLIREGFPVRLSAYPTAGRGPIHNALLPTGDSLDRVLGANRQGAAAGILVHLVRADLPPGHAPKADDLSPRALLLDLDGTQADGSPWTPAAILARAPMKPALLVETSPHRFHAVFGPLADLDPDSFRLAGRRLAELFAGSDPVTSPTKTLRLPGSLNMKNPDRPFLVRIVEVGEPR